MKLMRSKLALVALLGGLAACAQPGDFVTRTVAPDTPLLQMDGEGGAGTLPLVRPSYTVAELNVTVPTTLKVSEANSYKPRADIVWRGDPMGNRYEQIETIFRDAMGAGVDGMEGERPPVRIDIQVTKFHALTERTRYSIGGGTHDIHFAMTVFDAETGVVIEPTRLVETELTGLGGGRAAIAAEAQGGQTQKVRISAHLKNLIVEELTAPPREMIAVAQVPQ